jgi:hypothetical protein
MFYNVEKRSLDSPGPLSQSVPWWLQTMAREGNVFFGYFDFRLSCEFLFFEISYFQKNILILNFIIKGPNVAMQGGTGM